MPLQEVLELPLKWMLKFRASGFESNFGGNSWEGSFYLRPTSGRTLVLHRKLDCWELFLQRKLYFQVAPCAYSEAQEGRDGLRSLLKHCPNCWDKDDCTRKVSSKYREIWWKYLRRKLLLETYLRKNSDCSLKTRLLRVVSSRKLYFQVVPCAHSEAQEGHATSRSLYMWTSPPIIDVSALEEC